MTESMSLVAALERVSAAMRAVHDETCVQKERFPCITCPAPSAIAAGLDALDASPSDVRSVRRAFHDRVCTSGCTDDYHARRTQSAPATALRRFHRVVA